MTIINRFRPFSRGRMKRLIQVVFVLGVVFGLNHELKQFSSGVNVKGRSCLNNRLQAPVYVATLKRTFIHQHF